jgi:hypothetical protein
MTANARFITAMIAVNIAVPLAMSAGLGLVSSRWPRLTLFYICVIVLFTLNQYVAAKLPSFRKWVWSVQALNLIATALFGTVGFVTSLSALRTLVTQVAIYGW